VRSSSEEAVSQLNKWKSESTSVFVSTTGLVTLWFVGQISHASSAEVHVEIRGIDSKDFKLSISLHGARFEYRDRRELPEVWSPRRDKREFESILEVLLEDDKRVIFAELEN
jgi:hypothetical protein